MINARAKVTLKTNTKIWDRMVKNLSKPNVQHVRVGWFNKRNTDGIPLAQIASWNEEGHLNGGMFEGTFTPPRPFIRINFLGKIKDPDWFNKYIPLFNQLVIGKISWKRLHEAMGNDLVNLLQESILEFKTPPNSLVTINMKGFDDPLIESGQMFDAVEYKVSRRNK